MARDPNQRKSSSLIEKPDEVPSGAVIPPEVKKAGIGTANGQYYAYRVIYADGRSEFEWYKRGAGGGPDQPDPVDMRTEAPVASDIQTEWEREEAKSPATRNINGVPHQVTGKDANGQDIWSPVQTSTGPATSSGPQRPAGATDNIEGTPLPGGGFDNERPIYVTRGPDGRVIDSKPLTPAQMQEWRESRERSRNPGGKTDAEIKADEKDAEARNARPGTMISEQTQIRGGQRVTVQTWRLPDGSTEERIKSEPDEAAKPGAATLKPDGKGGTIAVQTMPDGSIRTTPVPGVPSEATSKYKEVQQDKDTGLWWGLTSAGTWEQMAGGPGSGGGTTSAGPAGPKMDIGSIQGNLTTYHTELMRRMSLPDGDPDKINPAQYRRLWDAAIQQAQTSISEAQTQTTAGNALIDAQTTDNSTRAGLANTRLNSANTQFQQAVSAVNDQNRYLQPGSRKGGRALAAALGIQQMRAEDAGGYWNPPPLQIPEGVRRVAGPTRTGFAALDAPPPVAAASATGPTPPNALGLGAIGNVPAPGGPPPVVVAPSAPLEQPQAVQPSPVMPEPIFRPQPPVEQAPVQMAPQADRFAALAPPQAAGPAPMPLAMMSTEARQAVPWKLDNDTIQRYLDAGVDPADIFSLPGVA